MSNGRFGKHGGQYVSETLMNAVLQLDEAYKKFKDDPEFLQELKTLYHDYANRPSLLYYAEKMTKDLGGAKIYLKREVSDRPIAVGFGISTPEQAKEMAAISDGAIVGSAIVKLCAKYGKACVEPVREYVKKMADAVAEAK